MPLRISDIIKLPELHTHLFAGKKGIDNIVSWAHVCELSDPTEWLGEGHLLMTTGIGVPKNPKTQKEYIKKLVKAGLSGIMIGQNMQAPDDISTLKETAEKFNFPVLMTKYGVPFSSVIRTIFDAERKEDFERRNAINRIFVSARLAICGLSLEQLLRRLEKDIQAELMLLDSKDETYFWYPKNKTLSPSLQESIVQQPLEFSELSPVIKRYTQTDGELLAISVPSRTGSILFIKGAKDHFFLDYSLLHQLVAVIGIAIEHRFVKIERFLRIGSQLLDDIFNQSLSHYDIEKRLEQFNLSIKSIHLAVARPEKLLLVEWSSHFIRLDLPVILKSQGQDLIIITQSEKLSTIQKILKTNIGVSNKIEEYGRLAEALRESHLALHHTDQKIHIVFYGKIINLVPWIPSSLDEALHTFQNVLGVLLSHDNQQGSNLLETLAVFLQRNRSWVETAKSLRIHKTTLIYRMQKIESLTNRSLNNTEDVTVLWLALKAGEISGTIKSTKD